VLGNLEVRVDGAPLPVGHARQKAVLAVLATEVDRVLPVDRLIDRVWGERVPVRARSVVRTYVSNLRRSLVPAGITITWWDTGYRLTTAPDSVDLHRFRRLLALARDGDDPRRALDLVEQALALWRGEPLAELDTPWARSLREHLNRERAAALADRIDWALACGRHGDLLPELTTRAAEDPLDERVAGQVVLALYRSGRQADALEHYQVTRQRLVDELGADPGPALRELHRRVLIADPTLISPAVDAPHGGVAPRQLPAPPSPFVGRREELDRLDTALDTSGRAAAVVISALAGAGGIGKTWLALHWAHRNADRFPDGQLFVDLRGFSPDSEPLNPAIAVRGFLDALGVAPDRLPADLDAQAALYRSLVAGRRMLIVLDNAATIEQVVPLLPGSASCTVLVTGRRKLASLMDRHGAGHLQLGVLSRAEARALLIERLDERRMTAEPAATDELIGLCGRHPLALAITTRHVATRPQVHLAEFVDELRDLGLDVLDDDDPMASLPAVLSWSLRHLTAQQRTVFALLGIAPGPDIDLPAAASLTGLPEARARKVLHVLEDHSLLDRHPHGRYAMHDLIRSYAAATARDDVDEPARRAALDRVVDFYLHTVHTADRLLDPHRAPIRLDPPAAGTRPHPLSGYSAALSWLDTHHLHLLAAQEVAAVGQRHQSVWHLAWSLGIFHRRRGHRSEELVVWRAALKAADHLPDPTSRIVAHRLLGDAHAGAGQHDRALAHLHEALALTENHHDPVQRATTYHAIAQAWEMRGDDRRALEHVRHALDIFRTLDEPVWEAEALNSVGWYAAHLGDYDTARDHCRSALALHRRHHHTDGEAAALDSLGYIEHHTGHHREAVDHYQRSVALYRGLGHATEVANTLDNLGHPRASLGQHQQARADWGEALDLYEEQGRSTDAKRVQRQLDDLDGSTGVDEP
jgi:DNA-binding SARP family transcriptional activator/tetratricopeptide (TPR) repeat protein